MVASYREIRLDDLDAALAFVQERGSSAERASVRHRLSLAVRADGEAVGYGLCLGEDRGRFVVELALSDAAVEADLARPLADAVLRKMQSAGVGTARVRSLNEGGAEQLWRSTNWLDSVPETARAEIEEATATEAAPADEAVADDAAQAA